MPYFIDANIFIRALHKENEKMFSECISLLKLIKKNHIEAYTATVVLTEIVWTLHSFYKIPKARIIQAVKGILNINGLRIVDNYDQIKAIQIFEKYSIKYIDALIASNNEISKKKMAIVSYDKDFDKLAILRKEPVDVVRNFSSN